MAERLKRIGTGTILLPNRPGIAQTAAIVGKKEGEGPLPVVVGNRTAEQENA